MLARVLAIAPCLSVSVCPSQVGVLSKRLNESNWCLTWELPLSVLYCVKRKFDYLQKYKNISLWNFFLNSGLRKFRQGIIDRRTCYQLSSRKVDARSLINWTVVGQLRWRYLRAPTLDRYSLSQRLSSSVYSTILSRGSISDNWYLFYLNSTTRAGPDRTRPDRTRVPGSPTKSADFVWSGPCSGISVFYYVCVQEMSSLRAGDHDKALYELSQKRYSVCLLPCRAEPQGFLSLKAHSCGIPCVIPAHSSIAPLISRLVPEPEYFIGKPLCVCFVFDFCCFVAIFLSESLCIFCSLYGLSASVIVNSSCVRLVVEFVIWLRCEHVIVVSELNNALSQDKIFSAHFEWCSFRWQFASLSMAFFEHIHVFL